MTIQEQLQQAVESDQEYAEQEFQFTFSRKEISAVTASLQICAENLDEYGQGLCFAALARIKDHEEYQRSKRPRKGSLS